MPSKKGKGKTAKQTSKKPKSKAVRLEPGCSAEGSTPMNPPSKDSLQVAAMKRYARMREEHKAEDLKAAQELATAQRDFQETMDYMRRIGHTNLESYSLIGEFTQIDEEIKELSEELLLKATLLIESDDRETKESE